MTIRNSTDQDIPAIVELLKLSLGEGLMPKSEAFWMWKHIENPFGKSPVLLAFDKERLIGVRAFMRWEWKQGENIFKAVRAVDTAVHPNYQGQGVFSKLTEQLAEQCKKEGVHFIFNTPNKKSLPGYLKMGWVEAGRMKIYVRPILRLAKRSNDFTPVPFQVNNYYSFATPQSSDHMITNRSMEFMDWRYGQNPNFNYFQVEHENGKGIYRLKPNRFALEFRIVELFWDRKNRKDFGQFIVQVAKASGANVITFAGEAFPLSSFQLSIGPMVTTRQLNGHNSLTFGFWKPSMGDMEVF
jgi:GNAT superfamily N-acetyltransferase